MPPSVALLRTNAAPLKGGEAAGVKGPVLGGKTQPPSTGPFAGGATAPRGAGEASLGEAKLGDERSKKKNMGSEAGDEQSGGR